MLLQKLRPELCGARFFHSRANRDAPPFAGKLTGAFKGWVRLRAHAQPVEVEEPGAPAVKREAEEDWAGTDGKKTPRPLPLAGAGCAVWLCAEVEAQGQKSNDQIMERVSALHGADGFRREYGLCWKCIVAGAISYVLVDNAAPHDVIEFIGS